RATLRGGEAALGEGGEDALGDLVDGAEAVDLDEEALVAEHLEQRGRLALVDLLAVTDRLLGVVDPALLGGAKAQPAHDLVLVGDEPNDAVERVPVRREQIVEVL